VDDNGPADDTLGSDELDELVVDRSLGVALSIRLDVAEVTYMAVLIVRAAVGLAVRVDCRSGAPVSEAGPDRAGTKYPRWTHRILQ